jgi:methylated-DNA-[protein]-cysteine S-methyltransferase
MRLASAGVSSPKAVRSRLGADVVAVSFETELGWMAVAFAENVLLGIVFGHQSQRNARESLRRYLSLSGQSTEIVDYLDEVQLPATTADLVARLKAHAKGELVDFGNVRIDERHLTEFGRKIVRACRRIPRGQTRSYGELAASCGSSGAARAVGQVMARNRYPLVVPCHRVLASGGRIGGFSSPQGLTMKRRLLALEGQFD